jgi:hypothetical protein
VAKARREDDPYEEALVDPAFLEAVGAAYRGRLAVLDALWWWSHPQDPASDGRPSPAVALSALQRRAFAADGDAAGNDTVARAILEAQADLAAERAAIESAVAAVRAGGVGGVGGADVPPSPSATAAATDADALAAGTLRPGAASAGAEVETTPGDAPPRRRVVLAAVLAAAVVLGAVLGGTVTAVIGSGEAASDRPAAPPTSDPAPTVAAPVLIGRIFDRIQTAKDVPAAAMPTNFTAESFRYLGSAGWTDADVDGVTDTPYYAVRGTHGTVCLVVVQEDSGYLSTCAIEAAFPAAGLRLSWQAADLHPAEQDGPAGMVLDITVTWLSDATVETRGSGRPRPSP